MKDTQLILIINDNISPEIIKSIKTLRNITRVSKDQQKKIDKQKDQCRIKK